MPYQFMMLRGVELRRLVAGYLPLWPSTVRGICGGQSDSESDFASRTSVFYQCSTLYHHRSWGLR